MLQLLIDFSVKLNVRLTQRFAADPLERLMVDAPMEVIRAGADAGGRAVAEFVKGTVLINAPWETGHLANSLIVYRIRKPPEGVLSKWKVSVPVHRFDGYYYPLAIEFGWEDVEGGYPWLRPSIQQSAGDAIGIYRKEMAAAISQNKTGLQDA